MRRLRLGFSLRWMMVAVAFFAAASLGWREYKAWLRSRYHTDPVSSSQLNAEIIAPKRRLLFVPGETTPVTITYDFKLAKPKPGVSCLVVGMVWLEDQSTNLPVDGFSFDVRLTGGERESCTGTITWDAVVPKPGRYLLICRRYEQAEGEDLGGTHGGGTSYQFVEEEKP